MVQIIPAILATTEQQYKEQLDKIEISISDGWVHIDFMDNNFVPNHSISPELIAKYPTKLKKEAHLMVKHFRSWVYELEKAQFARVVIHYEADEDRQIRDELWYLEDRELESGVAIKPKTQIEKIKPFLNDIDVLLILGVEPGFQGQQFIPETINKIKEVVNLRLEGKYDFKVEVDGGIAAENAKLVVDAGADNLVVGSYLLKGNIDENLERMWEALR